MEPSKLKRLEDLRNSILSHLNDGSIVVVFGPAKTGKSVVAKQLLSDEQFRQHFIPLIDMDHVGVYRELLNSGGWASSGNRFYFVDSYCRIPIKLDNPALIVSQFLPSRRVVGDREVVVYSTGGSRVNPFNTVSDQPPIILYSYPIPSYLTS